MAEKGLLRGVSRAARKRRINRELEAKKAQKPRISEGLNREVQNRELGTFNLQNSSVFSSQFALHGLRALDIKNLWGQGSLREGGGPRRGVSGEILYVYAFFSVPDSCKFRPEEVHFGH